MAKPTRLEDQVKIPTWVSFTRWPFFSSVRLRVFSRKGGSLISSGDREASSPPVRRNRAPWYNE